MFCICKRHLTVHPFIACADCATHWQRICITQLTTMSGWQRRSTAYQARRNAWRASATNVAMGPSSSSNTRFLRRKTMRTQSLTRSGWRIQRRISSCVLTGPSLSVSQPRTSKTCCRSSLDITQWSGTRQWCTGPTFSRSPLTWHRHSSFSTSISQKIFIAWRRTRSKRLTTHAGRSLSSPLSCGLLLVRSRWYWSAMTSTMGRKWSLKTFSSCLRWENEV